MKKQNRYLCIYSFSITFLLMLILFWHYGYAPFGGNSMASHDASVQYLDFYSYFKDVLSGKNNITYTFSKTLGGNNIGVFSYYLTSPFMLLCVFFKKTQLHAFFDVLVMLKLSTASFTFCLFLTGRFHKHFSAGNTSIKNFSMVILSVSYGLCQYSIAQSCNLMWLDGVYMLPLILLGVYHMVCEKTAWKLAVPVALSILFNWYTGGINCLFSGIWLFLELCLYATSLPFSKKVLKSCLKSILYYIFSMFSGVLCSCILFLPTISAMRNSNRGQLDLYCLKNFSFTGNILTALSNYVFGSTSVYGCVSLFCGTFAILGLIALFLSKKISRKQKLIFGCFTFLSILLIYWFPFYTVFSLFKNVSSYWYRYSYINIFGILFVAAVFYLTVLEQENTCILVKSSLIFALLMFLLRCRLTDRKPLQETVLIILAALLTGVVFSLLLLSCRQRHRLYKQLSFLAAVALFLGQTAYNTQLLMNTYHVSDDAKYRSYSMNTRNLIDTIRKKDSGIYRISQTTSRKMLKSLTTANYDEAFGFNYRSIAGYTSSPDDNQRDFLEHLGYRKCGENMNITNASIIGADSLLGVKYILSPYRINGLQKISSIKSKGRKKAYRNPYALPFALIYPDHHPDLTEKKTNTDPENPFEYQNYLYSILYGQDISIYEPLHYRRTSIGNSQKGTPQIYSVDLKQGNYAFYGNIPWDTVMDRAMLTVNKTYTTRYSWWLAPSLFYIPSRQNARTASVSIKSAEGYSIHPDGEQFYGLNLDTLSRITRKISSGQPDKLSVKNGYIRAVCHNVTDDHHSLYLSVPYDRGWQIYINGKKTSYNLIDNCLYSLPLKKGDNTIEMRYVCPMLRVGAVISILGILLTITMTLIENKKRRLEK